jgi:hypothetical protein
MIWIIIILLAISFSSFLEKFERINSKSFWHIFSLFSLIIFLFNSISFQNNKNSIILNNKVSSILVVNQAGGGSKKKSDSFVLQTISGKRKRFDILFHCRLEKYFPDNTDRIVYQKKQEKFYKAAQNKAKELKKLRIKETPDIYTKEELDSIHYFQKTGFYRKYQDPDVKPNIFDTRQTFLLKMHNPIFRNNFLNSFNSKNY